MKALDRSDLRCSRSVRRILRALSVLAQLPVRVLPSNPQSGDRIFECKVNPWCQLLAQNANTKAACLRFQSRLQSRLCQSRSVCAAQCFAGLKVLAVPILIAGLAVGTLICGGYLARKPTHHNFARCMRRLRRSDICLNCVRTRKAYGQIAFLSSERTRAVRQMLLALAQHVGEMAGQDWLDRVAEDPPCVARAKALVESHLTEPVRTAEAAQVAHVTEEYFCRRFRAATGMSFSEYVARMRIEQAKKLLANPALRVTDVAFAAGFQSIPHFNHLFKRHNGTSPKQYRAKLTGKIMKV